MWGELGSEEYLANRCDNAELFKEDDGDEEGDHSGPEGADTSVERSGEFGDRMVEMGVVDEEELGKESDVFD